MLGEGFEVRNDGGIETDIDLGLVGASFHGGRVMDWGDVVNTRWRQLS